MGNVKKRAGFKAGSKGSGFHMTFENGWKISVQWSEYNYAQRADRPSPEESNTAECAVWNPSGGCWKLTDADNVRGWMSPGEVSELMERVRNFGE
jgi:hypothetical protein